MLREIDRERDIRGYGIRYRDVLGVKGLERRERERYGVRGLERDTHREKDIGGYRFRD